MRRASAAAIAPTGNLFNVIFDGIMTVTKGSNMKLAGNVITSALDTLTVTWGGPKSAGR